MRVLVGTDGSPDAVRAADWLARFPLPAASQIPVVSVLPHLDARAAEHENAMHAQARQVVDDARLKLNRRGRVQLRSVVGNPSDEIIAMATTTGAQLIVLGSRGIGRLQRLVLGSVSESVLLQSECTVMITKRSG